MKNRNSILAITVWMSMFIWYILKSCFILNPFLFKISLQFSKSTVQDTHITPYSFHLTFFKCLIEFVKAILVVSNNSSLAISIMQLLELISSLLTDTCTPVTALIVRIIVIRLFLLLLFTIVVFLLTAVDLGVSLCFF